MDVPKEAWAQFLEIGDVKDFREEGYEDPEYDLYLKDHVDKWFAPLTSGVWVPTLFRAMNGFVLSDWDPEDLLDVVLDLMKMTNDAGIQGGLYHSTMTTDAQALLSIWKEVK